MDIIYLYGCINKLLKPKGENITVTHSVSRDGPAFNELLCSAYINLMSDPGLVRSHHVVTEFAVSSPASGPPQPRAGQSSSVFSLNLFCW